jgi:hypothetical protein
VLRLLCLLVLLLAASSGLRAEYPVRRPPRLTPAPAESGFAIHPDRPLQVILGLGFEIQSDSIASGNLGLPDSFSSVPHDLVPEERARFYREMLRGFRYCRLAGGLYWRGLDAEGKHFVPRWPEQGAELREMVERAGIEGISFEYWSPAPYWKANRRLAGKQGENTLRCFGKDFAADPVYHGDTGRFLADFARACRRDLETLRGLGLPVAMWGLQNEPTIDAPYSSCVYTPAAYSRTFLAAAPQVRAFDPKVWITADDWDLASIRPALDGGKAAPLLDAFVIHDVGCDSAEVAGPVTPPGFSQPAYQNEYEYIHGPASPDRCLNTVQHLMNWFQLAHAPVWFWIHALKPVGNAEASGYALGFWRPPGFHGRVAAPGLDALEEGHWTWNPYNWNAVVGFLRRLPWNSRVVALDEEKKDDDLRILAFRRPDGKLVLVASNRAGAPHIFRLRTGLDGAAFRGWRYTPDDAGPGGLGQPCGILRGGTIAPTVPDRAWEFWEQE